MNVEMLRKDFVILNKIINSNPLIYFDNAATSQKPIYVINKISNFYSYNNSNILRGVYSLAEEATLMYDDARKKVAKFLSIEDENQIVFTSGATEGINFVATAWAENNLKAGDQILLTEAEHHANFLPWVRLREKIGIVIKFIRLNKNSFFLDLDLNDINEKTKLVAVTHSSNVLGDVWRDDQLYKLVDVARKVGAKVLIDSAQAIAHKKIDIKKLAPDFLVFSGHKVFGPTGIGILYINKKIQKEVDPYMVGGSMVYSAVSNIPTWNEAPQKFEAGTPPIAQAVGLAAAIDYLNENINFDELKKYESSLCEKLIDGLQKIGGVNILGNIKILQHHGHLVSFFVDGIHAHDLAGMLGSKNICVRAGHHCAQPLFLSLGIESSLRVSFCFYNMEKEVDIFLKELKGAINFLS